MAKWISAHHSIPSWLIMKLALLIPRILAANFMIDGAIHGGGGSGWVGV